MIGAMARPREFDEELVLRAIRDQFWNAGYAATSLQDLMRVSGLGKGSLYAAYGDKHQLFLRALHSYVEEGHGNLRKRLGSFPRAIDALRAVIVTPTCDAAGARRGCLLANSATELASADPETLAEARRGYDTTTALIAECVVRAQVQGDIAQDKDPVDIARAILTAQQGVVFMGRTGLDNESLVTAARTLAMQLLPAP
jgi:TetR/AcrR family transcriptional regulator, transcriptional repressor for nem operon